MIIVAMNIFPARHPRRSEHKAGTTTEAGNRNCHRLTREFLFLFEMSACLKHVEGGELG
jgi:hypothetical protein